MRKRKRRTIAPIPKYQKRIMEVMTDYRCPDGKQRLTQEQMADELEIDVSTYSNYELGKKNLPLDLFAKTCGYTGISADYLLGLSNYEHPEDTPTTELLGLSEQAIEAIKGYDEAYKLLLERMITGDADLLKALLDSILYYATCSATINYHEVDKATGKEKRIIEADEFKRITKFNANDSFNRILDSVYDKYQATRDIANSIKLAFMNPKKQKRKKKG